ncbi:unnamed protein product [Peniophora sp. CBMAI 1063]|nr:unnamed protein product [Peniophora sp. CBMAI 1063]
MSTSRMDELRGLLAAMGAPISEDSRFSGETLERKLRLAIGYAQNMPSFACRMPINPIQLPVWNTRNGMPAHKAFAHVSLGEAAEIERAEMGGGDASTAFPMSQNAFMDLRQTLMSLTKMYEEGRRGTLIQDEKQQSSIAVQMLGLYALDTETPLLSLLYEIAISPEEMTTGKMVSFVQSKLRGNENVIVCTPQEFTLVRRLLDINSSKVAPEYEASLSPDQRDFRRSFIIPVGPLDQVQIGKITHNTGCVVCGSESTKNCSGCKIEKYCSSACQKANWKDHKVACRDMQGGTWTDFVFTDAPSFNGQKLYAAIVSSSATPRKIAKTKMHGGDGEVDPPPNKHGDRAFLIKIQRTKDSLTPQLPPQQSVYDRLRTMSGYLEPESNVSAWSAFEREIPPQAVNVKIYRWARRIGDWGLSICLDRPPKEKIPW